MFFIIKSCCIPNRHQLAFISILVVLVAFIWHLNVYTCAMRLIFIIILCLFLIACRGEDKNPPPLDNRLLMVASTGTGAGIPVVWRDSRVVLTCAHVVGENKRVILKNTFGDKSPGKVSLIDYDRDIAVVKPKAENFHGTWHKLLTTNKNFEKGEIIYHTGWDMRNHDINSDHGRIIRRFSFDKNDEKVRMISISANVDHGSSGGGVWSTEKKLVGMASHSFNNSGWAISVNEIIEFLKENNNAFEK